MDIQESLLTFPFTEDMQKRIIGNGSGSANFDRQDILRHFGDGHGWICEAQQDLEDKKGFISQFFDALMKKDEIHKCPTLMIIVEYSENKALMMEDLTLISEYMGNFPNKELMWNANPIQDSDRLKLMAIAVI